MKPITNYLPDVHYDIALERQILGIMFLERDAFSRISRLIKADFFYDRYHRATWTLFVEIWGSEGCLDAFLFTRQCRKDNIADFNGHNPTQWVVHLFLPALNSAHLERWALILRELYVNRLMLEMTNSGLQGKSGFDKMAEISQKIKDVTEFVSATNFQDMEVLTNSLLKTMVANSNNHLPGITTGIEALDDKVGGFMKGGMYILAARPSVGKSAMMGKMILAAAMKGHHVAVISLEMTNTQITGRLASLVTGVEYKRIMHSLARDYQQTQDFERKLKALSDLPIMISDTAKVDMLDITGKLSKLKQKGKIDILFIDYLQLLDTSDMDRNINREQQISQISRGCKMLAKENDIPVIVLAQVNRASEQSADKKPKLHHLRESGSLEANADGVLLLHRPHMSGIATNESGQPTDNEAELIIAKWRDGELGEIKLGFDGAKMKFYEVEKIPF